MSIGLFYLLHLMLFACVFRLFEILIEVWITVEYSQDYYKDYMKKPVENIIVSMFFLFSLFLTVCFIVFYQYVRYFCPF